MAPETQENGWKRSFGVVHGIAECSDCDWKTDSYKNAQALAAKHARRYRHRVNGEVGCAYTYDGRNLRKE